MTSDSEILTQRPVQKREWVRFCLGEKNRRRTSTGSTSKINGFFSPFIISVDGMMVNEAQVVLDTLSRLMDAKMEETILHVKGWVNDRITIVVARFYSWMLCGS